MPIKVTNFGGLYPKASARALPNDGAQAANNMQANITEFRPLNADTTVVANTGITNPLTIFRLQRNSDGSLNTNYASSTNWKTYAADVNLVKGPLNDNTTDRHYLTYNDGSAPPRVIDATGTDRQLGVPAPTVKPAAVVNVVSEFTVENRGLALIANRDAAIQIIRSNASPTWVGATHPGLTTSGYLDHKASNGFAQDELSQQVRWYRLTGASGTVSNSYSGVAADQFGWIFDPALAPFIVQAGSGLSWATAGQYHLGIGFVSYGRAYTLDTATITTQLGALIMPGTVSTPALTGAQITEVLGRLQAYGDPTLSSTAKAKIDALSAAVDKLKALLDGGARGSIVATTQAFYSKADVAQAVTDAIANAAESIFAAADGVARSSLPADYGGSGAA